MAFEPTVYSENKPDRYESLLAQASALMDGITHAIANLANLAALLFQGLEDINWCGFYLMDSGALMLGPFCGLPACIRIPLGRGVCGTAALKDETQLIYDVHAFPGHIACDSASNSEIVIPIHFSGKVIGVLDVDSPTIGRFNGVDQYNLEKLVHLIESCCDFSRCGYTL